MFSVYVIKSLHKDWYYVGMSENVEERIKQHNSRNQKSTKFYAPFKLVYTKNFKTRLEARNYEKFLKVRSNKEKLIKSFS